MNKERYPEGTNNQEEYTPLEEESRVESPENIHPDTFQERKNENGRRLAELEVWKKNSQLEEVENIIQQTNEIEAELERQKSERLRSPSQRSVPQSRIKRWIRGTLITFVLGGLLSTAEKDEKYSGPEQNQNYSEVKTKKNILEATGIDLVKLGAENGFKVKMEVDNGNGEYVVHVGQLHNVQSTLDQRLFKDEIIESQKNIEKTLLTAAESLETTPIVFLEGIVDSSVKQIELLKSSIDILKNKKASEINILDFSYEINNLLKGNGAGAYQYHQVAQQKAKEVLEYYSKKDLSNDTNSSLTHSYLDTIKDFVNSEKKDDIYGENSVYKQGAVLKLYFENKIQVDASENAAANDAGVESLNEIKAFRNTMHLSGKNGTEEYHQKLDNLYQKSSKLILEPRENIAIEKIGTSTDRQKIKLLVYGDAHEFKNNVEEWNAKHPDHTLGLITLHTIEQSAEK